MQGNLKILFISTEYPPETGWGGIGSYVSSIAPALAAQGHEVHVLSCAYGQASRDYTEQGVYVHRRGQLRIRGLGRIVQVLGVPDLITYIRGGLSTFYEYRGLGINFDVIEYPEWGAEGWVFALLHRKPLVAHLHTPIPLIFKHNSFPMTRSASCASFLERLTVRRADMITSPSQLLVKALREIEWLGKRDVEVIPYPIDSPRWCNAQPVSGTPPRVIFLGRVEPRKAPELLVEAISIIRREIPEAHAIFVGKINHQRNGWPDMEWAKKPVVDTGGCQFVGQIPRHELNSFLSTSRVLAMPSWFDNYPMAGLEAMAAGRPVVVTSTSGIAELIEPAGVGHIIPPGDADALAEMLRPFLTDQVYAAQMGEKARVIVQEQLDPSRIATRREAVYRQAISRFKNRRRAKF